MHKAGDLPRMQVVLCESILYLNISSVPGWQELLDKGCGFCQWHGHKANHHQGGEDWRQGSIQGYKCNYSLALWKYLTSGHLDRDSKLFVPWGRPAGAFRLLHCLQLQAWVFLEGWWMMVVEGPGQWKAKMISIWQIWILYFPFLIPLETAVRSFVALLMLININIKIDILRKGTIQWQ